VREITSLRWLVSKALLLVVAGSIAAALLIARTPALTTVALLAICIWAFARSYYFLFYVIERYVDPAFRFSGVFAAMRYLVRHRRSH